ncbi:MAG: family 10 glycosylhydrolase [Massilibacteroides sp.]|nr:family 10 glycosylhydrolase [Massilibacteroides sp.]MDD3061272.1 family 10 glycosylhydrolase [Massilibacteroides sp.]MDD4114620.1 family 10 glycosylhydrolase [Massilibacteroides sp.]MDD4659769.1 family 10 glycosylhydrolase [Massilibacteroides sp.]
MKNRIVFIYLLVFLSGYAYAETPKFEIRAAWLTTVYGLDWPKHPATTKAGYQRQREELCLLLDSLQNANFNMIFLQVRLRGDVIYRSAIEPFSKIFTGKYGVMPDYDPLAFGIEECHKRGMECHAWFVTFPVGSAKVVKEQGNRSAVKRRPELCKRHNDEWYLDPGLPETRSYLRSLVNELIANYDVDGIHFDYIRYPEKANRFPDRTVYRKYGKKVSLDEWRRTNISSLVSIVYDDVKRQKPWVQVSSSPLGKYSRISRFPNAEWTAYESVFQDVRKWLQDGKQDMVVPMMYYLYDDFFPFVDNWVENANGRFIVPGLGAYRLEQTEGNWELNHITDQIDYCRSFGGNGTSLFRVGNVLDDSKGFYSELKNTYYKYPAILPPLTWLCDEKPASPEEVRVERKDGELILSWKRPEDDSTISYYTVYSSLSDTLDMNKAKSILATGLRDTVLYLPINDVKEQEFIFSVSASNRYRIESLPSRETYYYYSDYIK